MAKKTKHFSMAEMRVLLTQSTNLKNILNKVYPAEPKLAKKVKIWREKK